MDYLSVFIAMALTDICWCRCVYYVKEADPLPSAWWAVALFLTTAIAVIGYTTNPWLLIPAVAGAFVGTYVGVWSSR